MCRWLSNIFFPLQKFGRREKIIVYDTSEVPSDFGYKSIMLIWTGKSLDVSYTLSTRPRGIHPPVPPATYSQEREVFHDGDWDSEHFKVIDEGGLIVRKAYQDKIYIKCTGVTYLIINGERYI